MQDLFLIAPPEVLAAHGEWMGQAAEFAGVAVPPPVMNVSASAAAVAACHAQVAEGHAQFGERLFRTASTVRESTIRFLAADEQNANRIASVAQ